jgi:phage tail-like protein
VELGDELGQVGAELGDAVESAVGAAAGAVQSELGSAVGSVAATLRGVASFAGLLGANLGRIDPLPAYTFFVEVDGIVGGGFSEVTGLQVELETQDYREGGRNDVVHRLPGPARYPANVVLRRGLMTPELWAWFRAAAAGTVVRRNLSILMQEPSLVAGWRWSFVDAYPVRWTGPELNASSSALAFESVEIAHRGFDATSGMEVLGVPV